MKVLQEATDGIMSEEEEKKQPQEEAEEARQQQGGSGETTQETAAAEAENEEAAAEQEAAPDEGQEAEEGDKVTISFAEYEELKTLAKERDDYLKRLQRSVADYQNLRKRLKKERKRVREQAIRDILENILPLADTLTRALESAEQSEGSDELVEGFKLIQREFYEALENLDVRPVKSVDEPFDPEYHHAVLQEPREDVDPNTVVNELKKGFVRGDDVIRPAQVSVSVKPRGAGGNEEEQGDD